MLASSVDLSTTFLKVLVQKLKFFFVHFIFFDCQLKCQESTICFRKSVSCHLLLEFCLVLLVSSCFTEKHPRPFSVFWDNDGNIAFDQTLFPYVSPPTHNFTLKEKRVCFARLVTIYSTCQDIDIFTLELIAICM